MGLAAAALVGAMTLAACGSDGSNSGGAAAGAAPPSSNLQDRPGLRHRRPRRQVVQRLGGGRPRQGQGEFGIDGNVKRADRRRRRDRHRPGDPAQAAGQGGFNPIIARRLRLRARPSKTVAPEVPGRQVRASSTRPRRREGAERRPSLTFAEEQGSYLVGAAAGAEDHDRARSASSAASTSPLIQKFEAGYKAGAKAAKPGHKVDVKYLSPRSRTSPASTTRPRARRRAKGMYDGGADIIYAAAGGSGSGVFTGGGGRRTSRPSASTPTSTCRPTRRCRRRHHDLDAQAGRRRRARTSSTERQGRQRSRPAQTGLRPQGRRRRLRDVRWPASTTSSPSSTSYKQQIVDGTIKVPTTVSCTVATDPAVRGATLRASPPDACSSRAGDA